MRGEGGIPPEPLAERLGEVLEVTPRRLDGRDALDVFGGADREDAGAAVDRGMGEPALGARDDAGGRVHAARARILADDEATVRVPRESLRAFALVRDVEERGEQRARLELSAGDELRDGHHLRVAALDGLALVVELREGQRAVRGTEIDPHRKPRHPSSTSAGARTCASWPPTIWGSSIVLARQPRWRSTPAYGG